MDHEQQPLLGEHQIPPSSSKNDQNSRPRADRATLGIMVLGAFLSLACESFVASTHEEIASYFNALSLGPWMLTAYSAGYSMMLPLYGSLTEVYGAKRMLLSAHIIFSLGCIITGCASSMQMALAGRFVASIGGAGMIDLVSIILNKMAPLSEVAVLRSYLSLGSTLGVSCGPPLGGLMTDTIGWRWSFLCQVPIALLCFAISAIRLPADSPDGSDDFQAGWIKKLAQLDWWGYFFLVVTIGCLLFSLHFLGEPVTARMPLIVSLSVTGVVFGAIFVLRELYNKKSPVVPLQIMPKNGIGAIFLGQILLGICQFTLVSNVSSFLIHTKYVKNSVAGVPLVFYAVGTMVGSLGSGRLIRSLQRCKTLSFFSLAITIIGWTLMVIRWRQDPHPWEMLYTLPVGMGIGALFSNQFIALAIRAPDRSASIITTYYLAQQLGAIIGTTTSSGLFQIIFHRRLSDQLVTIPGAQKIIHGILQNNHFASSLPKPIQLLIRSNFLQSFEAIPIFGLSCSVAILPLMIYLKDIPIA